MATIASGARQTYRSYLVFQAIAVVIAVVLLSFAAGRISARTRTVSRSTGSVILPAALPADTDAEQLPAESPSVYGFNQPG